MVCKTHTVKQNLKINREEMRLLQNCPSSLDSSWTTRTQEPTGVSQEFHEALPSLMTSHCWDSLAFSALGEGVSDEDLQH